jgi:arginyl-tRNA synthetase
VTPEQLSAVITHALATLVDEGRLALSDGVPTRVVVERPKVRDHGDYATNIALQLAKKAGLPPRGTALKLVDD